MYNVLVVVIAETTAQLLVVHFRLVLTNSPTTGHLVRIRQLEFPAIAGPRDEALARFVRKEFQQKLPELNGT